MGSVIGRVGGGGVRRRVAVAIALGVSGIATACLPAEPPPPPPSFQESVVFQGLENTEIFGTLAACSAYGAYLPTGSEDIGADDTATATETTMSFTVTGFAEWMQFSSPQTSIWIINHFSRYMLASG